MTRGLQMVREKLRQQARAEAAAEGGGDPRVVLLDEEELLELLEERARCGMCGAASVVLPVWVLSTCK